uniref:Putative Rho factor n=1 Tax=Oryza sativa subsp. japonica TaxID=39947 RepID=Q6UUS5_ORYSJ|nr:putative Rho factor [Oryza sativa Japonica Group]
MPEVVVVRPTAHGWRKGRPGKFRRGGWRGRCGTAVFRLNTSNAVAWPGKRMSFRCRERQRRRKLTLWQSGIGGWRWYSGGNATVHQRGRVSDGPRVKRRAGRRRGDTCDDGEGDGTAGRRADAVVGAAGGRPAAREREGGGVERWCSHGEDAGRNGARVRTGERERKEAEREEDDDPGWDPRGQARCQRTHVRGTGGRAPLGLGPEAAQEERRERQPGREREEEGAGPRGRSEGGPRERDGRKKRGRKRGLWPRAERERERGLWARLGPKEEEGLFLGFSF